MNDLLRVKLIQKFKKQGLNQMQITFELKDYGWQKKHFGEVRDENWNWWF